MPGRRDLVILMILFAAVRFGSAGPQEARGDESSPTIVTFGRSGTSIPRYAVQSGASWTASSVMPNIGAVAHWVVAKNCPTRNETAFGALDADSDVNIAFFNGATWSSVAEVCTNTGQYEKRAFDLAYEQTSGDLLIAYWNDAGGVKKIGYRTFNGVSLSAESLLSLPENNQVWYLSLTPDANSDTIMLLAGNSNGKLYATAWDGIAFGAVTELESNSVKDYESFSAAFEAQAGRCLVVYANASSNQPRSRTWNGLTWSTATNMPSVGSQPRFIRLASKSKSDTVMFGCLAGSNTFNANIWNGSSWSSNNTVDNLAPANDRRTFDIAFEPCGGNGLFVYCKNAGATSSRPRFVTWNGSSWSSSGTSSIDASDKLQIVQLVPGSQPGEIHVAISNESNVLNMSLWSGGSLSVFNEVEGSLSGNLKAESFMVVAPAASCLVPADTPYVNNFEGAVGDEWSTSTVTSNATYTKFLGRFRNSFAKLAVKTTPGTTYSLTFDLYTIDSWDGNAAPYGPDAFKVSVDGVVQFDHTFIHDSSWMNRQYTYPYPPDASAHFGFNGIHKDGIFRAVEVVFVASNSVTTLTFTGSLTDEGSNGIDDESWGIDNLSVKEARFIDVSASVGFNVLTSTDPDLYASAAHWGDFDNDGDLDVILTGNAAKRLISNNAGSSYSSSSFGGGMVYRQGAILDINNDGALDFWTSCASSGYDTERLFTNNGSAVFTSAGHAGFGNPSNNEGVAAADVNRDGWIDVVHLSENGNWIGHNQGGSSISLVGTNASSYGLHSSGNHGNGDFISSGDVNNDGYPDFFYHYNGGRLFLSNANGTYTRNNYGISVVTANDKKMGSAWADYDNDGDLDLYVARYELGRSGYLWRNDVSWTASSGTFTNVNASSGVNLNPGYATPGATGMRTCAWGDIDNDGDLDLVVAGPGGKLLLYENQGNGTFKRIGAGLNPTGDIMDVVFVDYDNDGDLDLSITRTNGTAMLFRNQTDDSNYLKVRLVGRGKGATNTAAIGVRLELWDAAGTTFLARRDIGVARGFSGTEPLWAHFGGVNPNSAYLLRVYFHGRANDAPYEVNVTPAAVSTTIGTTLIPQMITIEEPPSKRKVVKWAELRN